MLLSRVLDIIFLDLVSYTKMYLNKLVNIYFTFTKFSSILDVLLTFST